MSGHLNTSSTELNFPSLIRDMLRLANNQGYPPGRCMSDLQDAIIDHAKKQPGLLGLASSKALELVKPLLESAASAFGEHIINSKD